MSVNIKKHVISGVAMILFIVIAFGSSENDQQLNSDGTPKTERQIEIEKYFNAWDGSHIQLTKLIKRAMNDPDSYKHIETVYWDKKDHLIIKTTYSGKNAFGGRVKNWVMAKANNSGTIIEILEEGN